MKEKIANELALPTNKQKLNSHLLFLKDNLSLVHYSIGPGEMLILQLRERGGRKSKVVARTIPIILSMFVRSILKSSINCDHCKTKISVLQVYASHRELVRETRRKDDNDLIPLK